MKSSRKGQTRRPLARIHVIHEALASEEWPNCSTLAARLEVSVKTVQRDLDFMRDEFRLPIEFVPERNGYRYTAPVEGFPTVQVGMEELMALFMARKVMEPLAGSAVEQQLSEGFRRLSTLSGGSAHISWQELDHAFSIQAAGMMQLDVERVEQISRAMVERRLLRFGYTNAKNNRTGVRTVHPLHLSQVKGGWYLFAWDRKQKDIRIFALPRMREPEVLSETFSFPASFDLQKYLQGSMGLITEPDAPLTHVVIRLTGYAAVLVPERVWHHTQKIEAIAKDEVLLHLDLQHTQDLIGWVLNWGGLAEMLSPPDLREQVAEAAEAVAKHHRCANKIQSHRLK